MTVVASAPPHPIFLAGRWVESSAELVIDNPARPGEPVGSTFLATETQYEEAVDAAVAAFEVTRHLPAYERGRILREISAGVAKRRSELAELIAMEAGKAIRDALIEVDRAILTFRLGAEEAERIGGKSSHWFSCPPRKAASGSPGGSRSGRSPGSARSTSR